MAKANRHSSKDLVGNSRTFLLLWGLPAVVMAAGLFAPPSARTLMWSLALLWMGGACFANAHRCGRTHCRYTGPFFVLMALIVSLHGLEIVSLGKYGWAILGTIIVAGTAILWWGTERLFGKFIPSARS